MVFQFLTLIMDMFVWAFHDDPDPRMGKRSPLVLATGSEV